MAGHNKWSKIKRQKAVTDSRRSKAWSIVAREITIAARDGGGDPAMNARLALATQRAKRENMPKDNIERAIRRGTGESGGQNYEEYTYEGYAPYGVAVLVEALTDNTNRTVAALRSLFSKAGGSLGKSGSVSYLFDRKGVLQIGGVESMESMVDLAIEAGAEDFEEDDESLMVITEPEVFGAVHDAFEAAGVEIVEARLAQLPRSTVAPAQPHAEKILRLLEHLEDHQDVRAVYSNLDVA